MVKIFTGELFAEPADFTLTVKRLIVEEKQIRFQFDANESDSEPWSVEGAAQVTIDGSFHSSQVTMTYKRTKRTSVGSLVLKVFIEGTECHVEGTFEHLGFEMYELSGELEPFVPAQR